MLNLKSPQALEEYVLKEKFHFIRIKASRMNSLAQILFDNRYEVQGSDIKEELFTQKN